MFSLSGSKCQEHDGCDFETLDSGLDPIQARIGAFPFTTIEPNIGRGYVAVPDPSGVLGLLKEDCGACYGYAEALQPALDCSGPLTRIPELRALATSYFGPTTSPSYVPRWRRVPVTVKDVAGVMSADKSRNN